MWFTLLSASSTIELCSQTTLLTPPDTLSRCCPNTPRPLGPWVLSYLLVSNPLPVFYLFGCFLFLIEGGLFCATWTYEQEEKEAVEKKLHLEL